MTARPRTRPGEALAAAPRPLRETGYARLSTDPLHILAFLLPLVLFYEAVVLLSDLTGVVDTVAAHELINRFFLVFGDVGLYLPGLPLIIALVAMKLARGDDWTIRLPVLPFMVVESAAWAIPLLLIAALLSTAPAVAPAGPTDLQELPLLSRVALSIGAGLYEELLFRLLLVSAAAAIVRNIFRWSDTVAAAVGIAVAALAFTFYHHPGDPESLVARRLLYFVAGCFLGLVYVLRGFGIVVGAHAVYDLFVLVLLRLEHAPQ